MATKKKPASAKPGATKRPAKKQAPTKNVGRKKSSGEKALARKQPAKKSANQNPPARKSPSARKPGPRADLGAPIDGFIARQPSHLRAILEELRTAAAEVAPDADAALKWGMPFYTLNGKMMCALTAHKAHVNLILVGPPSAFADPDRRLAGSGKSGRHLKLTGVDEIPRASVRKWIRAAAEMARGKNG